MTNFEGANILLLVANGILVPIILYYVASGKQARAAGFAGLTDRLDHLDKCLDALRLQVVGTGITRSEFDARVIDLRKEMQEDSARQIAARHDLATRVQVIIDTVEERLTRRIERMENSLPAGWRPVVQGDGD